MIDKSDLVNIGTLARPHGVGGEVLLRLQPALTGYEPDPDYIFIDLMGGLIPLEVYSLRYKNEQELLLLLDTIDSEEKARRLQGSDVFIDPEQLGEAPDEGDFSLADLIGLSVYDRTAGFIGIVTGIEEVSNNPIAYIDHNGSEVMLPVHKDLISNIDLEKQIMKIDAPEGLIELNTD